jgi:hypothetical protein
MFGGVGYRLNGNMACGVHKEFLVIQVGPENHKSASSRPHTRPFDITGRAMRGWVMVEPEGFESDEDLRYWVQTGWNFAESLPAK